MPDDDVERSGRPGETEPLLTISGFARTVGLSASALRSYADAGLVVPAEVDAHTGYRYYTPEQQRRAILVRRLRDADVSLAEIRVVLGADRERARTVLRDRLTASMDRAVQTRTTLSDVLSVLERPDETEVASRATEPTVLSVAGPELASAIGQVRHAAGRRDDGTGLDGVLLDLAPPVLSVVATDRYWLARRDLTVLSASGPHRRLLLGLDEADDLVTRCLPVAHVRLVADELTGQAEGDAGVVLAEIPPATHRFPAWRMVLDQLAQPTARLVVPRAETVELLARTRRAVVTLCVGAAGGTIIAGTCHDDPAPAEVRGTGTGDSTTVQVSAALLQRALAAAVGTYLVLDTAGPRAAMRLSLPDQPGFVALVMPISPDA